MEINVIAIIVTYNGATWISRCLESLQQSYYPVDVVIIDNNSSDSTCKIIREHYPQYHLVELKENRGFAHGNNLGIAWGQKKHYDYFFLVNQDVYIKRDTLSKLLEASLKHPQAGIISPIHLNGKGDKLDLNFSKQCSEYYCPGFISDLWFKSPSMIYPISFVNAACWLITKTCLNKVGYFEELFFVYCEDDNYVQRCKYHQFQIIVRTDCSILHDREIRAGEPSLKSQKQLYRSFYLKEVLELDRQKAFVFGKVITATVRLCLLAFKDRNFLLGINVISYSFTSFFKVKKARKRHALSVV